MLTGTELLEYVKTNSTIPKDQLMAGAGYSYVREDGKTSYKTSVFMNNLLEAQGITLTPPKTSGGTGRQLSYKTSCMKNGNVTIGKAYFEKQGAAVGDTFDIVVGDKQIILKPIK